MEFYKKLPRRRREFVMFMAVISVISVNIIAPLITCFELGFSLDVWRLALSVMPQVWLCVVACVLVAYKPAEWLTRRIVRDGDSFGSCVTVNILCSVSLMSVLLTLIAPWVVDGVVTLDSAWKFFFRWPRNSAISLAVELLVAQPIARAVIHGYHNVVYAKVKGNAS